MNTILLKKYSQLIIEKGVNLQKNQSVVIVASVYSADLVRILTEECYKHGAKKVRVQFNDEIISKHQYKNEKVENLSDIMKFIALEREEVINNNGVYIRILSDIPGIFKDIDSTKLSTIVKNNRSHLSTIMKKVTNSDIQWVIVAYPNKEWAKIVFPKLSEIKAYAKLEESILKTVRVDNKTNPISNQAKHENNIEKHKNILNKYDFKSLLFKNSKGTNLKIDLPNNHIWCGGGEKSTSGIRFNANMPSEEIWGMPHKDNVNGKVYSTKPLSYNGNIINEFMLEFKNGKVIKYTAKEGLKTLQNIFKTNKDADRIGEVALVPYNSPISLSGILYFETLFDENASCHLALGSCYPMNIKGGTKMKDEEVKKHGGNICKTHIDFMFGSKDMEVHGFTKQNKKIQIFKNGDFYF